jgi:hypothetical protein
MVKTPITPVSQNLQPAVLPTPEQNDRYLAGGMHLASIFFPILAPTLTYFLAGKSKFVKTHSYQAIFETLILKASVFIVGAISLTYSLVTLWNHYQKDDWENFSWATMAVKFIAGFVLFAILELFNTIISIRQAIRAFQGEWPRREVKKAQKQP